MNFSTKEHTILSYDRLRQMELSEQLYATGSSYTSNDIDKVVDNAEKIETVGSFVYKNAASMMGHYLKGTGETYNIDLNSFFTDSVALENRNADLNNALRASEALAVSDRKISIYQVEESLYHNLSGDWKYSVGSYFTSVEITDLSVSGGVYTAKIKYIVVDFYNWDPNDTNNIFSGISARIVGDVSPKDLHQLHLEGTAKEFLSYGEATYRVAWVEGQDIKNILLK